ncbi:MAG: hypothetical protein VX438_13575, partial [Planctomycetota bacterium]|nr:hypothetical protein [Planctomycetota bacterium]
MKQIGILIFGILVIGFAISFVLVGLTRDTKNEVGQKKSIFEVKETSENQKEKLTKPANSKPDPRVFRRGDRLFFWWDPMPEQVTKVSFETGMQSNIHPDDYVGVVSCQKCHEQNFNDWAVHPHRWMNALAGEKTIKGSFTEQDEINYLGGKATFRMNDGDHQMTLTRDDVKLVYDIRQTLGSRFFQYYIGRLIEGPFAPQHPYRTTNHVLPFGYWLQKKSWVPVVHVGPELPDGQRTDPFNMPEVPEEGKSFLPYAKYCNMCHSTFALGDNF